MTEKKKNIIITLGICIAIALFFTVGTIIYSPEKEFEKLKQENIAKTGENFVVSVVQVNAEDIAKTIDLIGEIDQSAVVISSNFASTISFVESEGRQLKKGQKVVEFINGVAIPTPFDATISETFVNSGQNVAIGEKLFVVVPNHSKKTKMKIELPISYAGSVQKGMSVKVVYNESEIYGIVTNISVYSGSETGSVKTMVEMEKNAIPHNTILESMIEISKHKAYFVPKASVFLQNDSTAVKIINNMNKIETVNVEIIKENEEGFYIASEQFSNEIKVVAVNPVYAQEGIEYSFNIIK